MPDDGRTLCINMYLTPPVCWKRSSADCKSSAQDVRLFFGQQLVLSIHGPTVWLVLTPFITTTIGNLFLRNMRDSVRGSTTISLPCWCFAIYVEALLHRPPLNCINSRSFWTKIILRVFLKHWGTEMHSQVNKSLLANMCTNALFPPPTVCFFH